MFSFVVKYLGYLKHIPLMGNVYDSIMRIWYLITNPIILDFIDELESFGQQMPDVIILMHPYGGLQFDFNKKELAHIHSNGLLDVLLSKKLKAQLLFEGRISSHHVFPKSGWISFYIKNTDDLVYAKKLLSLAYQQRSFKNMS
ncbi:luciferase family protein [Sphingobacterium sp. SGL-16]|uniref:DUF5519 family protein n=1 Tax=Sphingobacterium litopenaei TaxID=2763500 RepID=A0ABR7YDN9_9SPHI|nr:luciferase family protein [Sphingobacterium sp. SGL-16]MBD1429396.1 DUF5519 family protein [Sphingobacterium litopenaei]